MARLTEDQKWLLDPRSVFIVWVSALGQVALGIAAVRDGSLPLSLRLGLLMSVPCGIATIASHLSNFAEHRRADRRWFGDLWRYLTLFWLVVVLVLTPFHPLPSPN